MTRRGATLRGPGRRRIVRCGTALLVMAAALLGACRATRPGTAGGASGEPIGDVGPCVSGAGTDRPFREGTPGVQESARALVAEVPRASMDRRLEISRRLTTLGEPGVHALLEALRSPDPAIRAFGAWTLGYASDLRALPALDEAESDPVKLVSLEAAAARVRLGDDGGLGRMVEGLEDSDPRIRARCLGVLESRTGRTFDFLPDDPPSERAAAVERWRVYLRERTALR